MTDRNHPFVNLLLQSEIAGRLDLKYCSPRRLDRLEYQLEWRRMRRTRASLSVAWTLDSLAEC